MRNAGTRILFWYYIYIYYVLFNILLIIYYNFDGALHKFLRNSTVRGKV